MNGPSPLPSDRLRHRCDPAVFPFATTLDARGEDAPLGQEQALEAVRFGIGIRRAGYNLFVLGPPGLGKHTLVRRLLDERADGEPVPDEWAYVQCFATPYTPRALRLPPGRAAALAKDMDQLVDELKSAIPAAFESDAYRARLEEIEHSSRERQENAFKALGSDAEKEGVALLQTPNGFAFGPMKEGEVIGPDDYEQLPDAEKKRLEAAVAGFQERLQKIIRQIPQWRREHRERVKALEAEVGAAAVGQWVDGVKERHADLPAVTAYLDAVRDDVLAHLDTFRKPAEAPSPPFADGEDFFRRYKVNVLVGRGEATGAPVVFEDNPTHGNLIGRVEHLPQWGALVTDFTLIKPGALHRANGGYLLLDAREVLLQPFAWEALKRALRAREVRVESLGQALSLISTVSLEPEPIPLDVKVVLFGDRTLYYLLSDQDPDFPELFKVAADFEEEMPRTPEAAGRYAALVATLVRAEGLLPFGRDAVARLLEEASREAEDAERLSTRTAGLADLLRESDFLAREAGREAVSGEDVREAVAARVRRADRLRRRYQEEMLRGTVLMDTDGERVGQVNGLVVYDLGSFAFGQPSRITATTRMGEGDVVNIEREVELSGPIHSKGVLILSAFLAQRYARERALSLSATLAFEQSYGEVDGDSASVAELAALLSSLAEVPVRQSLAVTGSINQHGEVQAIGGVNEKIEGFFDLCRERGLTGEQGVVIPAANVKHLMLRDDVVEAAARGDFHVWAVTSVDEALTLLTGLPAGEIGPDGQAPQGSLNAAVIARLEEFERLRHAHEGKEEKPKRRRYGPHHGR